MTPTTRGGWGKMAVGDLIFQYLGDLDNEGTVHWTIAKSMEAEDDGLTYTITLWDCVYDSIGNNITADDVVWSFEKYRDEGLGSSFNFDHWKIISDYELQWVCSSEFVAGELE
ncbi:MAG: ABC transporter substrate-binding protein [Clostridiales bacterium]|nr:ABC transporter substrate-binding protein [Clostridiales bacterium]